MLLEKVFAPIVSEIPPDTVDVIGLILGLSYSTRKLGPCNL
jgi:hypothetical protein